MSTRSNSASGRGGRRRPDASSPVSVSRYDAVLALIPAIFLLAIGAVILFGVPIPTALAAASVLSVAAVVDALFLNPPTNGGPTE